ncbi:MAG: RpiB/LacA/LacB family sugar-phosphate isomerase [Bacilli bacterium]
MIIGIASDHRGTEKKKQIIDILEKNGITVVNYGTDTTVSVDYPLFAFKVGEAVSKKEIDFGILLCGTGIGMSIACNKVIGIRCAKVNNKEEVFLARSHNNANVISLSSDLSLYKIRQIIKTFIETTFSNEERHIKRNNMIDDYVNKL